MPSEQTFLRVLREARTDRVAMAGFVAAVLCDQLDALDRVDAAVLAARDVAQKSKRGTQTRELSDRIVEIGSGVQRDLEQLVKRGALKIPVAP